MTKREVKGLLVIKLQINSMTRPTFSWFNHYLRWFFFENESCQLEGKDWKIKNMSDNRIFDPIYKK